MVASVAVEGNEEVLSGINLDEWLSDNLILAICSFFFFLVVQRIGGCWAKVEWVSLVHSIITAVGSVYCVYLDQFYAETMTGTSGASICSFYHSICLIPCQMIKFLISNNSDFTKSISNLRFCKISPQTLFE